MNLKEFKNVNTKPCDIEFDESYLETLANLPTERPRRRTLEIISTVAAAVVIITLVSVWAIIGRGVRGPERPVASGEYTELAVTDEVFMTLQSEVFYKYDVLCFRDFNEKYPMSVHEILQTNRYAEHGFKTKESYVTGKTINQYANSLFGTSPADEFALYGCMAELGHVDFAGADIQKVFTKDTDGGVAVRVEYTEGKTAMVLEYIGSDLYTPAKFTANYPAGSELVKDYADAEIYKIICAELEADKNVQSYILYLPAAPEKTDGGYTADIVLLDYAFVDGEPHSILGLSDKLKPHQTAELTLEFKKTENGLVLVKESDFTEVLLQKYEGETANEYRVTGDDAVALKALFNKNTKAGECICTPTHALVADGRTYKIAMGDTFCSHYSIDSQKYTFTTDEYKQLAAIFEKWIVKDSFTKTVTVDAADSNTDRVRVTRFKEQFSDDIEKQITIIDTDKKLISLIESKTFAEDVVKTLPDVAIEIGDVRYAIEINGDKPYIRANGCYQCNLKPNDEIITLVKRYLTVEGTTFAAEDGFYKTYDKGKTYKKYMTKQKAIDCALAAARAEHKWAGEMYYDPEFLKLEFVCGCLELVWDYECLNSLTDECRKCWVVYLLSREKPDQYGLYFVDAITGEVAAMPPAQIDDEWLQSKKEVQSSIVDY